jgi:hypothetical protein
MSMGGNGPQSRPEISKAGKWKEGAPAEELGTESDRTDVSADEEEQVHKEEEQSIGDTLSGDDSDSDSDELVDAGLFPISFVFTSAYLDVQCLSARPCRKLEPIKINLI